MTTDSESNQTNGVQQTGPYISAVIKAKNEEDNIVDAIRSLRDFADEVIVVDDNSSDRTARLALDEGAIVIEARSRDGVINKLDHIGFTQSRGVWVLRMDSDERMQPLLADTLKHHARAGNCSGIRFARKNMIFGKWIRHGGWFKADQLRFFRNDAWDRDWFYADIHSQVPVKGTIIMLEARDDLATVHYDYDSVHQFINRTINRYAHNEALIQFRSKKKASLLRLFLKPPKRFFGRYILRLGFLDGMQGFLLAMLLAVYDFCIEAMLWDMRRRGKRTMVNQ